MNFNSPVIFGKTSASVGRLGIGSAYNAKADVFEMAFERGCSYFVHDAAFGKGIGMTEAIIRLCETGQREKLFIVAGLNWRLVPFVRRALYSFLKKNKLDYVDGLIIPWFNKEPAKKYFDLIQELKEKRVIRFAGITGHNRSLFPELAKRGLVDFFHTRYNAVHRGAETDVFEKLRSLPERPGVVSYTATCWRKLLTPRNIPAGEKMPAGSDCYRFVLTNPDIDVCMTGPRNRSEMEEALTALDKGPLDSAELAWMKRVGDHIYG